MTWPIAPIDTTDADADTDSPLLCRQDILDAMQKLNQMIAHVSAYAATILDDADAAAVRATLGLGSAAVEPTTTFWSTGDVKLTLKTAADAGWVLCNDGTIGDATSGGTTRANADTSALFTLLWTNVSDTYAPVSSGRGASAAADFAAHKTIGLTKMLGRALGVAGAGSGLTARALGEKLGAETVTIGTVNLPAHTHTFSGNTGGHSADHTHSLGGGSWYFYAGNSGGDGAAVSLGGGGDAFTGFGATDGVNADHTHGYSGTTSSVGSGTALNVMNPVSYLNAMLKL